jgi:AcrR family transcriptional regulator
MSSSGGNRSTALGRARDASASRASLLAAAREIFDEAGYERATTREIGLRAGLDPSLIARYFDGKEGLFLAALAEAPGEDEVDFEPDTLLTFLIERWDERGHSPISRALASPSLSGEARNRVRALVRQRLLKRLTALLEERGVPQAGLRAELLVALAVGVSVTRANGTLAALAAAPREELLELLGPVAETIGSAASGR